MSRILKTPDCASFLADSASFLAEFPRTDSNLIWTIRSFFTGVMAGRRDGLAAPSRHSSPSAHRAPPLTGSEQQFFHVAAKRDYDPDEAVSSYQEGKVNLCSRRPLVEQGGQKDWLFVNHPVKTGN